MDFLIENLPVISLAPVNFAIACIDMTCEGFSTLCRANCGGVTCGTITCGDFVS